MSSRLMYLLEADPSWSLSWNIYCVIMTDKEHIHIGTCSWKYASWKDLVYTTAKPGNYLKEYGCKYSTVEVDQWFWSLFGESVVLPKPNVVREYAESVPDDFLFGIKVPNSITLTHHYKKRKTDSLVANPHFLSVDLMNTFLDSIEPLHSKLGPLIFQFEYLNKLKMAGQREFLDKLGVFIQALPIGFLYAVESRNPNYLNQRFFTCLKSLNLTHVFLQGYYMPSIFDVYEKHKNLLGETVVVRLHGPNREDIEALTGNKWGEIVEPRDRELEQLAKMVANMQSNIFVFVNNHFEGSAPRTIKKLVDLFEWSSQQ